MASVFKRSIWLNPTTGKSCRKDTLGAKHARSRIWYYKVIGDKRSYPGYTDKTATTAKAAEHEKRLARGEQGLIDHFAEHRKKPLSEHVREYLADLKAAGRDKAHIYINEKRLEKLAVNCNWTRLPDITANSFVRWREGQSEAAPKTLNHYLGTARAFCRWCMRLNRLPQDPLANISEVKINGDVRRQRRALTIEEIERLLAVAGSRKVAYLFAILTGARRGEMRQLQWGDVHLDCPDPFVELRASTTKNGKRAVLWLRDDLAAELHRIKPDEAEPTAPVFKGVMEPHKMRKFNADLKSAGIPRVDAQGRIIDWHSMRHTTATLLARSGVSPRTAQEIMRHSDQRLTNVVYTDVTQLPTLDAMARLPRFDNAQPKATGKAAMEPSGQTANTGLCRTKGSTMDLAFGCLNSHLPASLEKTGNAKKPHISQENERNCATLHSAGKMRPLGIEPRTHRLKVCCSTS